MTGHVRRQGEGSWELKFDVGTDPLTGKRRTRYATFKGTKRDAQKKLDELSSAADKGTYVDPSKLSVSEYLDRWDRDWASINVSPKTLERYREIVRVHVKPHIGGLKLQKLRPVHLGELYAKLLREGRTRADGQIVETGLSPRTVGHVHRVVHKALAIAAEWNLIQQNPADIAKAPKVASVEIKILDENQIRDVLDKMRGRSLYPIAALALATGMRRGELLALRWKDVDLDGAKLRVEQSLEQTKKGGLRFKSPKTKHGRRAISLPSSTVSELRAHWKAQQELRLKLGQGKAPDEALVFGNWDGTPRSPNAVTKEWGRALADLKLPKVSLHALRHTHASQLIAAGMDILTISRRLGHGSPTITLGVYGHLFSNTDAWAAEIMEAAFSRMTD